MSMFFALRGMAELPVESMKNGGLSWFTDLTIADPYFLLPMLTSASLLVHIKVGGDGISVENQPDFVKKIFYAMPFISIPIMCQFPAALNLYWFTSNLFTITSSRIIGMKSVSKMLKIGEINPAAQAAAKEQWSTMFQNSTTANKQPSQMQMRIEEEMRKIEEKRNARQKPK